MRPARKAPAAVEASMSGCQFQSRLAAYHDGELDPAAAEQVELHLAGCKECTEELAGLREVSAAMSQFDPGEMTPMELARLHREIDRVDEGSLVRLGVGLIGMAASVLIISLAWIGQGPTQPTHASTGTTSRQVPVWERLASGESPRAPFVTSQAEPLRLPPTGVAKGPDRDTIDWMLNGLQPPIPHESR